jgi:hypothetical protein
MWVNAKTHFLPSPKLFISSRRSIDRSVFIQPLSISRRLAKGFGKPFSYGMW